jgi:arylsulfatase
MKNLSCLLGLVLGLSGLVASAAQSAKPNVLVILADDMGYSDLGCYGSEIQTPNLDTLSKGGLRFTQFYNTARCWPTRGAIMTGYYAQQIRRDSVPGIVSGGQGTRPEWARLVPDMLKPLGYRAYHSGKWHIDGKQLAGGFDHSYSIEDHNHFFNPKNHTEDDEKLPPIKPDSGFYVTTHIADHAIKCLKEHSEKYSNRPFFHYLCFTSPHFPLQALPEDIARYKELYRKGWDVVRQERWQHMKQMGIINHDLPALEANVGPPYHFPTDLAKLGPGETNRPAPWRELSDGQREFQANKMAIHAAMIDRMDREIGRVLGQLRQMNALDNTLILFLSDNGASAEIMVRGDGHDLQAPMGSAATFLCLGPGWSSAANTPLRRHKTWVHEGGISTSLVVHWPKGISARGELRHNPGHLIDIVPTILEVAGAKPLETWAGKPVPPLPGKSLVPAFARDGAVSHDYLWWQHEGNRALRMGDWKVVAAGTNASWELYNLAKDRGEANDLAAKNPEKLKQLADQWEKSSQEIYALAKRDLSPEDLKPKAGKKKGQKKAEEN